MQQNHKSLTLLAPAKINLLISVIGKRSDGYHDVETLFQFLNIHDTLTFTASEKSGIQRKDEHNFNLPKRDLIIQSAELLREKFHRQFHRHNRRGIEISLKKIIPPGAGMGGGSSNAATTLIALNYLWELGLSRDQLINIGKTLGADVPLFIHGQSAWATARGDEFLAHTSARANAHASAHASDCASDHSHNFIAIPAWYCIIIPAVHVSTALIFAQPNLKLNSRRQHPQQLTEVAYQNALQPLTEALYPPVKQALDALRSHEYGGRDEYVAARMNGSGGSVFLKCQSEAHALKIRAAVQSTLPKHFNTLVSRSSNRIVYPPEIHSSFN